MEQLRLIATFVRNVLTGYAHVRDKAELHKACDRLLDRVSVPLYYLASPYSHESATIREQRATQAAQFVAHGMANGIHLLSPVALCVNVPASTDWQTWAAYDLALLGRCDELWVLALPGWESSVGVGAEMSYAQDKGIPVRVVNEGHFAA